MFVYDYINMENIGRSILCGKMRYRSWDEGNNVVRTMVGSTGGEESWQKEREQKNLY